MERLTKLVVLVSMAAALLVAALMIGRGWSGALPLVVVVFLVPAAVAALRPELAAAIVLPFAFVFPALIATAHGRFEAGFWAIWTAALLGVVAPAALRADGWALPLRWRAPLVYAALVVAVAWPIVVLRELDFTLQTLEVPRLSVAGPPGVPPAVAILWIVNVASTLGVGVLWFDWLCATFATHPSLFRRTIVGSLAAGWAFTCGVGLYQMFVDVTFLNSGQFGFLERASGLMLDANPYGIVAALGAPAAIAWGASGAWPSKAGAALAVVVSWLALWASGSRTAFATGVVATGIALTAVVIERAGAGSPGRRGRFAVGAGIAAAGLVALLAASGSSLGPMSRLQDMVRSWSGRSIPDVARELWDRNTYGTLSTQMIREFPLAGVGVGAFNYLVLDYQRAADVPVVGDNAQNWLRHQLAELGLLGAGGWLLWTGMFAWFLLIRRAPGPNRTAAAAIKGAILAIALISLVGMPTQTVAVTITFWTLVCWWLLLVDEPDPRRTIFEQGRLGPRAAAGVALLALLFAAGTIYSAGRDLRVPMRAAAFGWPYAYGFHAQETGPAGPFRWAARHGVLVIDAPGPWMALTLSVNHPDLAQNPVEAAVSVNGGRVMSTTLRTVEPVTEYVRVPAGHMRLVLETRVNRVVRPSDFGQDDPRELGVMVAWTFVDAPP